MSSANARHEKKRSRDIVKAGLAQKGVRYIFLGMWVLITAMMVGGCSSNKFFNDVDKVQDAYYAFYNLDGEPLGEEEDRQRVTVGFNEDWTKGVFVVSRTQDKTTGGHGFSGEMKEQGDAAIVYDGKSYSGKEYQINENKDVWIRFQAAKADDGGLILAGISSKEEKEESQSSTAFLRDKTIYVDKCNVSELKAFMGTVFGYGKEEYVSDQSALITYGDGYFKVIYNKDTILKDSDKYGVDVSEGDHVLLKVGPNDGEVHVVLKDPSGTILYDETVQTAEEEITAVSKGKLRIEINQAAINGALDVYRMDEGM